MNVFQAALRGQHRVLRVDERIGGVQVDAHDIVPDFLNHADQLTRRAVAVVLKIDSACVFAENRTEQLHHFDGRGACFRTAVVQAARPRPQLMPASLGKRFDFRGNHLRVFPR